MKYLYLILIAMVSVSCTNAKQEKVEEKAQVTESLVEHQYRMMGILKMSDIQILNFVPEEFQIPLVAVGEFINDKSNMHNPETIGELKKNVVQYVDGDHRITGVYYANSNDPDHGSYLVMFTEKYIFLMRDIPSDVSDCKFLMQVIAMGKEDIVKIFLQ